MGTSKSAQVRYSIVMQLQLYRGEAKEYITMLYTVTVQDPGIELQVTILCVETQMREIEYEDHFYITCLYLTCLYRTCWLPAFSNHFADGITPRQLPPVSNDQSGKRFGYWATNFSCPGHRRDLRLYSLVTFILA